MSAGNYIAWISDWPERRNHTRYVPIGWFNSRAEAHAYGEAKWGHHMISAIPRDEAIERIERLERRRDAFV